MMQKRGFMECMSDVTAGETEAEFLDYVLTFGETEVSLPGLSLEVWL